MSALQLSYGREVVQPTIEHRCGFRRTAGRQGTGTKRLEKDVHGVLPLGTRVCWLQVLHECLPVNIDGIPENNVLYRSPAYALNALRPVPALPER